LLILFFGIGLYVFYVISAYYAGILNATSYRITLATLFVPIPEIIITGLLIYTLQKQKIRPLLRLLGCCLGVVFLLIFSIQFIFIALTGEFISSLALANIGQAYLIFNYKHAISLVLIMVLCLYFMRCYKHQTCRDGYPLFAKVFLILFFVCNLFILGWQNSFYTNKTRLNKYMVGQTPIVGITKNTAVLLGIGNNWKTGPSRHDFPFIKNKSYKEKLPFQVKNNVKHPNVIVIFTEGTSARLLGCYGGKFVGLTPNIDAFADASMRVDNYFNHTAATFRGTHGQLASCYPYTGGWMNGGWAGKDNNVASLVKKRYQTLPNILNVLAYDTVFLSPHAKTDPYTRLLEMLKFKTIYTGDSLQALLDCKPEMPNDGVSDKDMYQSAINFLEKRTTEKPFLLSFYTFHTHAFIDKTADGVAYGKGDNMTLNTLHTCDAAFGEFWQYFKDSRYKDNTILVFTADHAHYFEKPYLDIIGIDPTYKKVFFDKIPLIIYDEIHQLPKTYDARDYTSVDLTPTILQLLGLKDTRNSFMGTSIFENTTQHYHICYDGGFYGIGNHALLTEKEIPEYMYDEFKRQRGKIEQFHACEQDNRVFK